MDHLDFGRLLDALAHHDVLALGSIEPAIVEHWGAPLDNTLVVLTGERWRHVVERHPEVQWVCEHLPKLLGDPDEVHRNLAQVNIA